MTPSRPGETIGITGGSGAVGTRLLRHLAAAGVRDVRVFDERPPETLDGATYHQGTILDIAAVERALRGCTVVFHLAAIADGSACASEPLRCMELNVLGTARVLEACRRSSVPRFVYASTGQVYGLPRRLPVDEEHPTEPCSLYAASKLAAEALIRGYCASFGNDAVIARLANIYGPGFGSRTVTGQAVDQILSGGPVRLRSLEETRDFLYVDDAVEALMRLAGQPRTQMGLDIVNVSTGCGVAIAALVDELAGAAERLGLPRPVILPGTGQPDTKVPTFFLDNRRLRQLTGWVPAVSLREGLERTLAERRRG